MKRASAVISGALSGLGVIILLQQYSVAYPTLLLTLTGIVLGIAAQFAVMYAVTRRPVVRATTGAAVATIGDEGPSPTDTGSPWAPTHRIPETGSDAWVTPDPTTPPAARLDPQLEVQVERREGDWAHIICENGWSAWVDARVLEARQ